MKIDKEVQKYVQSYNTKKGLRWRVAVSDGKGGQLRHQGFIDKLSALAFAKEKFKSVIMKDPVLSYGLEANVTFEKYASIWIEQKKTNGMANRTISRYSDMIKLYVTPFFDCFKISEIQKVHMKKFIQYLHDEKVSSYNCKSSVIIAKMILRQAFEDDYLADMGALAVKTPKHRSKEPKFWDYQEFTFFLNASRNSKSYNLWKFILFTGLRAGEVAALKWDCVHLDMKVGEHIGYITVKRTCEQRSKAIFERTKNHQRRVIPILPEARDLLLELAEKKSEEFVFGGREPIDIAHLSRELAKELENIPQVKKITFHALRHSFCSFVEATGMNRRVVAEIMGHKDLNTTNRYSHISNQALSSETSKWIKLHQKRNLPQDSNKVS